MDQPWKGSLSYQRRRRQEGSLVRHRMDQSSRQQAQVQRESLAQHRTDLNSFRQQEV